MDLNIKGNKIPFEKIYYAQQICCPFTLYGTGSPECMGCEYCVNKVSKYGLEETNPYKSGFVKCSHPGFIKEEIENQLIPIELKNDDLYVAAIRARYGDGNVY